MCCCTRDSCHTFPLLFSVITPFILSQYADWYQSLVYILCLCFLAGGISTVKKAFSRILFTTLLLACIFLTFASPTAHPTLASKRPIYGASTEDRKSVV